MGFHFTPTGVAVMKQTDSNKCWQGCVKLEHPRGWWGCKMMHLLWKTAWRFLKMLTWSYHVTQQFHS